MSGRTEVNLSDEERQAFISEAMDQIDEAEAILLEMEAAGSEFGRRADDAGKVDTLFRAMHTLKGNAGSLELGAMEQLSHAAEDVMEQVRCGDTVVNEEMADLMLEAVDQLRTMVDNFAAEESLSDPPGDLLLKLEEVTADAIDDPSRINFDVAIEDLLRELPRGTDEGPVTTVKVTVGDDADLPGVRMLQCLMECETRAEVVVSQPTRGEIEDGEATDARDLLCLLTGDFDLSEIQEHLLGITGVENAEVSTHDEMPVMGSDESNSGDSYRQTNNDTLRYIKVDVMVLDRLMNLTGEMVINRNRLASLVREMQGDGSDDLREQMQETVEQVGRATMSLQEDIMEMRLLPLDRVFKRFPRMMRNLRKSSSKEFRFVVRGGQTEIDRSLMEIIADPLTHLLRNAVDHGLERPEVRASVGKDYEGQVTLSAHRSENNIVIEVSDDGSGIDLDALREKARAKGLLPADSSAISEDDLLDMIFNPGFTTREQVTELSGRGVGLDVVRRNIESVNGKITVENRVGEGTTFRMSLPLTVTTVKSLLVIIAGNVYVLPLSSVQETLNAQYTDVKNTVEKQVVHYRDRFIPVFHLRDFFPEISVDEDTQAQYLVVIQTDKGLLSLLVDDLLGEEDCVIKPLGPPVDDIAGISAATILPDGRVALILDAASLFAEIRSVERSVQ